MSRNQLQTSLDIQLNHGAAEWPVLVEAARVAEERGFNTLWIADHLAGDMMGAATMPECFTTLGGLAAATTSIGLGSLVVNVGTRHPGIIANAAATVQQISGGRFTLGLGAGASPTSRFARELHALDIPVPSALEDRHRRLEDTLNRIEEMWSPKRDPRYAGFPLPNRDRGSSLESTQSNCPALPRIGPKGSTCGRIIHAEVRYLLLPVRLRNPTTSVRCGCLSTKRCSTLTACGVASGPTTVLIVWSC